MDEITSGNSNAPGSAPFFSAEDHEGSEGEQQQQQRRTGGGPIADAIARRHGGQPTPSPVPGARSGGIRDLAQRDDVQKAFYAGRTDPNHEVAAGMVEAAARVSEEVARGGSEYAEVRWPGGDAEDNAVMSSLAREAGVPVSEVAAIAADFGRMNRSEFARHDAERATATLRATWGPDYERNLTEVQEYLRQHPNVFAYLARTPLANNPAFIAALHQHVQRSQDVQRQVAALQADPAFKNVMDPRHETVVRQMYALMQRRYGSGPAR